MVSHRPAKASYHMVVQVRLLYAPPWRITEVGHNGADLKSVVAKAPWVRILHPPPCAINSVGRVSPLQGEGHRFKSYIAHHMGS